MKKNLVKPKKYVTKLFTMINAYIDEGCITSRNHVYTGEDCNIICNIGNKTCPCNAFCLKTN